MTAVQNDKQYELLLSAIDYLISRYAAGQSPCIALAISRHYRLLAEACTENRNQTNCIIQSSAWFGCYLESQNH